MKSQSQDRVTRRRRSNLILDLVFACVDQEIIVVNRFIQRALV